MAIHPPSNDLARFVLGMIDAEAVAGIEQHVASCDRCCDTLRGVEDDMLVARLRQVSTRANVIGATPFDRRVAVDNAADYGTGPQLAIARRDIPAALRNHPRYRITQLLGVGGMGEVYLAQHQFMERPVALKVISRELVSRPEAIARFRREVKAAARLSHPNIVAAYDADQAADLHFLVMEYVEGTSLAQLVDSRGPLPIRQACDYARQTALGLAHAHEHGMIHRDIKPQNLMVTPQGQVKILDLGLSRLAEEPSDQRPTARGTFHDVPQDSTSPSMVIGTADYIAPEQACGHTVDARSDLYSLGCTLYFLLTGRPPFPRGSVRDKLLRHLNEEPLAVERLRLDVPPPLSAVVRKLLAKNPADRYISADELAAALDPLTSSGDAPPPTSPAAHRQRARPFASRRSVTIALASLACAVLTAPLWFVMQPRAEEPALSEPGARAPLVAPAGPVRPRVLLILSAHHFWAEEYVPLRRALERAGIEVKTACSDPVAIPDHYHKGGGDRVRVDHLLADVQLHDFTAIVFIGGVGAVRDFYDQGVHVATAQQLVRDALAADKYVAGIGYGSSVLAQAGILIGKKATGRTPVQPKFHDCRKILERHGAIWTDAPVVVEGRILTGRDAEDAEAFAQALIDRLKAPPPRVLLVLAARGFWAEEYVPVRRALEDFGVQVRVASGETLAKPDFSFKAGGALVHADMLLPEAQATDFDAVVFLGGSGAIKEYCWEQPAAAEQLIRTALAKGKHVAGMGYGATALAAANALRGRKATSHRSIDPRLQDPRNTLERYGATWVDEPVVIDGLIITACGADDAQRFVETLLACIKSKS